MIGIPDKTALRIVRYLAEKHYERYRNSLDEIGQVIEVQQKGEFYQQHPEEQGNANHSNA